jgi:hypothetical protein
MKKRKIWDIVIKIVIAIAGVFSGAAASAHGMI